MMRIARIATLLMLTAGAGWAQQSTDTVAPEAATVDGGGFAALSPEVAAALEAKEAGQPVKAQTWMVAAANPHAVQAGAEVLRAGGSAASPQTSASSLNLNLVRAARNRA